MANLLYPPAARRASALATAHARVQASLAASSPLLLGIGRDGLVSAGRKIETAQVRAFARALNRRNGGLQRIEEDVEAVELERFLAIWVTRGQPVTCPSPATSWRRRASPISSSPPSTTARS
jgi:hypothetical protein